MNKNYFAIRPALNVIELRRTYQLVYQQYVANGYMSENNSGMRFTLIDLLPITTTFVAVQNDELIGTISAALYAPGLFPSYHSFQHQYTKAVKNFKRIGEGTKLACAPTKGNEFSMKTSLELVKWLYFWGQDWKLDELYVVVNPRHASFWEKCLSFSKIAVCSKCSHVKDQPGLLFKLDLHNNFGVLKKSKISSELFLNNALPKYSTKHLNILKESDIYSLILECPDVFVNANEKIKSLFRLFYPYVYKHLEKDLNSTKRLLYPSNNNQISKNIDYFLDTYNDAYVKITFDSNTKSIAFRNELSKIIRKLEKKYRFACNVSDSVPDNLICDIPILSSIVRKTFEYLVYKYPDYNSITWSISLLTDAPDETKLLFCFLINFEDQKATIENLGDNLLAHELRNQRLLHSLNSRLKHINSQDLTVEMTSANLSVNFSITYLKYEGSLVHYYDLDSELSQTKTNTDHWNILVAEDNYINQILVKRSLQKLGHTVTIVENGKECLDIYRIKKFDCIIMDCQMPVMDGFEATRLIREDEQKNQKTGIPIVALTAFTMKTDMQRCLDAGMDAYLSKPLQLSNLINTLTNLIKTPECNQPDGLKNVSIDWQLAANE